MIKNQTRQRIIIFLLFITFFLCYLEWGKDQSGFVFQMAYDILFSEKLVRSYDHPMIFIPFFGLLLFLMSTFQKSPKRWIVMIAIALTGVLVLIVFTGGILSLNWKIILSTLPFILLSIYYIYASSLKKEK